MTFRRNCAAMTFTLATLAASGCGGEKSDSKEGEDVATDGGDDGDVPPANPGTVILTTIDQLPTALDPMVAYEATDTSPEAEETLTFDQIDLGNSLTTTATTGASLGRTVADLNAAFEDAANPSKAMCDTVNNTMKFVFEAGSPDFMGCIIKGTSEIASDETLYSGTDKVYKLLATMDGQTSAYLAKINVTTVDGSISKFVFHSCEQDDQFKQNTWFEQTFTAGKMAIQSKMSGPEGSISFLNLSAAINDDGKLVGLKTIEYRDTHAEENRFKIANVTQSPNNILYTGAEGGRKIYSFFELVDANVDGEPYAITKLAIGDGAALVKDGGDTVTQGWNGDTLSINAQEPRVGKVDDKESALLADFSTPNQTYSGDEVFDCDDSAAVEVAVPQAVLQDCMERFEIDQDGEQFCSGLSYP